MNILQLVRKNRFLTKGLPFITMLIGGSFGLKYFAQVRYLAKDLNSSQISAKDADVIMSKLKQEDVTISTEYEKLQEKDLDNWQNIRGPRPWEDSKEIQGKLRKDIRSATSTSIA